MVIDLLSPCARQTGKTTCAAGYLLWYAMFHPDTLILIAAHKYQGAQDIMQRVRFAYEECPDYIRCGVTSYNKGSMDFDNGPKNYSTNNYRNNRTWYVPRNDIHG